MREIYDNYFLQNTGSYKFNFSDLMIYNWSKTFCRRAYIPISQSTKQNNKSSESLETSDGVCVPTPSQLLPVAANWFES